VVARLIAVFHLDDHPDDLSEEAWQAGRFHTHFKGHTESAWRAVTHQPLDAEKAAREGAGDESLLDWGWLPAYLAVDIWREYLQRFRLEDLFAPVRDNKTALQIILEAINERLTKPKYRELGSEGTWTGAELPSREYALLQQRGIRVKTVVIPEILLSEEMEQALMERWISNWRILVMEERKNVERRRKLARKRGEEEAAELLGKTMAQACDEVKAQSSTPVQTLERALYHLRQTILSDPDMYAAHIHELRVLEKMWAWAYDRAQVEKSKPDATEGAK